MTSSTATLRRLAVAGICLSAVLFSYQAQAFKIHTHVWIADQLAGEIIANNGRVSIDGRQYALNPRLAEAIAAARGAFVMGTLGADIYPDMFAGQMTTHPGVNHPRGWQTDDWVSHVITSAQATNNLEDLAFAAGYALHAAMDTWAHSYVNLYSGNFFAMVENSETAERHVALESYLAKFHTNLRDEYPNSAHSDVYSSYRAPAEFVRKTLILNDEAAEQYGLDSGTMTNYYTVLYDTWRSAKIARRQGTDLAELLSAELDRIDPLLDQLPRLKTALDEAQGKFDTELARLSEAAGDVLDGVSNLINSTGIEKLLADNGIQVDLDAPAQIAKTHLDEAHKAYTDITNQIGYSVEGFYDPETIRDTFDNVIRAAVHGPVGNWQFNIERAVDEWVRAWEETGRQIMRPHDVPGRNTLGPLTQWGKCWGPTLFPMPIPAQLPQGCDAVFDLRDRLSTEMTLMQNDLIAMLPVGHVIRETMDQLHRGVTDTLQYNATESLNAFGQVLSQSAVQNVYGNLVPDPTGLATWLVRMWDHETTALDLDMAYSDSSASQPYIERRISPAIHKELNVCEGPILKTRSYNEGAFQNFAPVQNAITMSKLALLDANTLNGLVKHYVAPPVVNNKKSPTTAQATQQNNQQYTQSNTQPLILKDAFTNRMSFGVILAGAIRSIDGNHQWLPTSPPLPRVGGEAGYSYSEVNCRRYGYPGSAAYVGGCTEVDPVDDEDDVDTVPWNSQKPGFVLYRPEYRDKVFRKLFRPIAPKLCDFVGYPYPGVMCSNDDGIEAGVAFPPHFMHSHGTGLVGGRSMPLTRAAQTAFNLKARQTRTQQTKQSQSRKSTQTQSRQTQSTAKTAATTPRPTTQSANAQRTTARQTQSVPSTARKSTATQSVARQNAARTTSTRPSTSVSKGQAAQVSQAKANTRVTKQAASVGQPVRQQGGQQIGQQTGAQVSQRPASGAVKRPAREVPGRVVSAEQNSFLGFEANSNSGVPSWRNSYLLSLLSYTSYPGVTGSPNAPVNPAALGQQLAAWDLSLVAWVDRQAAGANSGSTQMLAATTDDALIFAVQGSTMSMADMGRDWWDNDLDFLPEPRSQWGNNVVLHDGFIDAAKLVFPNIRQIIEQHGANRKIWFTGHSLGGAVAVLSAMFVEKELNRNVQGVYIYGAPPVGNSAWAASYQRAVPNTHRWSLQNDPVTALMLQFPGTPFRHVGRRHNMDEYQALVNARRELVYTSARGARYLFTDLSGTHMQYWCRLHSEATNRNVSGLPQPPRFECPQRCEW